MAMGIYVITCIPTGQKYIGAAKNIEKRWRTHKASSTRPNIGKQLWDAYQKYGYGSFEYDVIESFGENGDIPGREQYWLHYFRNQKVPLLNAPYPNGVYGNISNNWYTIPNLKETRIKMNLTFSGMGNLTGVPKHIIEQTEKGTYGFLLGYAIKIIRVLNLPFSEIYLPNGKHIGYRIISSPWVEVSPGIFERTDTNIEYPENNYILRRIGTDYTYSPIQKAASCNY
jgi:DNA-binding XRE family transcriptional regulator